MTWTQLETCLRITHEGNNDTVIRNNAWSGSHAFPCLCNTRQRKWVIFYHMGEEREQNIWKLILNRNKSLGSHSNVSSFIPVSTKTIGNSKQETI
jgi:hypothetical protein